MPKNMYRGDSPRYPDTVIELRTKALAKRIRAYCVNATRGRTPVLVSKAGVRLLVQKTRAIIAATTTEG